MANSPDFMSDPVAFILTYRKEVIDEVIANITAKERILERDELGRGKYVWHKQDGVEPLVTKEGAAIVKSTLDEFMNKISPLTSLQQGEANDLACSLASALNDAVTVNAQLYLHDDGRLIEWQSFLTRLINMFYNFARMDLKDLIGKIATAKYEFMPVPARRSGFWDKMFGGGKGGQPGQPMQQPNVYQ